MQVPFYKPKNEQLKKYIDGYYFMSAAEPMASKTYWSFPNNFCIATIIQNAHVKTDAKSISVTPATTNRLASDFYIDNSFPVEIYYAQPRNELTVYFKPLAIHHFISPIAFEKNQETINDFLPYPDYLSEMEKVFQLPNREAQVDAIETYWLSKMAVKDLSYWENVIGEIEEGKKITEIAKTLQISRQHFHKLFYKIVGKSPADYRKTHRFKAIIEQQKKGMDFTELSYEISFYDQPHFNKVFKQLTGINPTTFFKKVNTQDSNFWLFD